MKPSAKRLRLVLFVVLCLAASAGLALWALRDGVSYFRSPTEARLMPEGAQFRLGGMVAAGSLKPRGEDLTVRFRVTDFKNEIAVEYKGLLPDLFREGQGVVAQGAIDSRKVFIATQVLARHDETYMPPEIRKIHDANKKEAP